MKRFPIAVLALALAGVALAAGVMPPVPDLDFEAWAGDSAVFAVALAFAVYLVRTYLWRTLDGDAVKVFSVALGAVGGAALGAFTQFFDGNIISGLVHGITAGVLSFVGVDGVRSIAKTGKHAEPVAFFTDAPNAGAWIVQTVSRIVPKGRTTAALEAVAPLVAQFADAVLTDDLKNELLTKIHSTLRASGLLPGKNMPA